MYSVKKKIKCFFIIQYIGAITQYKCGNSNLKHLRHLTLIQLKNDSNESYFRIENVRPTTQYKCGKNKLEHERYLTISPEKVKAKKAFSESRKLVLKKHGQSLIEN